MRTKRENRTQRKRRRKERKEEGREKKEQGVVEFFSPCDSDFKDHPPARIHVFSGGLDCPPPPPPPPPLLAPPPPLLVSIYLSIVFDASFIPGTTPEGMTIKEKEP